MQDKPSEIQQQAAPIPSTPQQSEMEEIILSQILALPLTSNAIKFAESRVNYAVNDFPNNPRAAYLLAKKGCYKLTPEEQKELEPYCFFPEENPNLRLFAKEKKVVNSGISSVEIVNYNQDQDIILDEDHIKTIEETLIRVATRTPQLARHLLKIFIIKQLETEKAEYGPNGEWTKRQCDDIPTGIVLTQQGYRTDLSHRIEGINNLEGTISHELGHVISYLYPDFVIKFKQALGYHAMRTYQGTTLISMEDGWEQAKIGRDIVFVHKATGIKSFSGYVPTDLSKLPSIYSGFYPVEDIADSFVAWVFDRPLDETRKKLFNEFFGEKGVS